MNLILCTRHGNQDDVWKTFTVSAGDAILTRPNNSHGLTPAGTDSLTVIISYKK